MNQPRFSFVRVLGHEIHVTEWGDPASPPLVMWHGLARTGRDFDELAAALSDSYFVLCPDTIGRGLSSWSEQPETDYCVAHYAEIARGLLDHYNIEQTGWIGTSMGGLIGMRIASGSRAHRLSWLVINDIGPEIPQDAIDRILTYIGVPPEFSSLHEAETWLRAAYAPFGLSRDSYWTRMTRTSVRRLPSGKLTTHYDPNIVVQFSASVHELTSWDRYETITLPTHVLRGATSDILLKDTAARMQVIGPRPRVTEFKGCGHAPALSNAQDIATIKTILGTLR